MHNYGGFSKLSVVAATMEGRGVKTGETTFDCPWKIMNNYGGFSKLSVVAATMEGRGENWGNYY